MHLACRVLRRAASQVVLPLRPTSKCRLLECSWPVSPRSYQGHRFFSSSSSSNSPPVSSWRRPDGGAAAVSVDEARRLLTVAWPATAPAAQAVQGSNKNDAVAAASEADEACSVLPLAWLRDSCQCPECFNAATQSRMLPFSDFNPRVPVKAATLSQDSSTLTVEWQDGHRSSYARQWLQARSFTEQARLRRRSQMLLGDVQEKRWLPQLAEFDYSELMKDDATLLALLRHLDRVGTLLVRAAPTELPVLGEFAVRLAGYLSPCNYGHTFEVKSKRAPSNAAYTSGYLALHIDQCPYGRRPGVQILHCISQPSDGSIEGGESLLADGFLAAATLRRSHPEYFAALASLPVDFVDYGSDYVGQFHFINRETVLRLNDAGEVDRVSFSSHSRDYHQNHLPAEQVQLLFDALKAFYEILSRPPCVIEHKMQTGDIQMTDNRRVLHGRRAFKVLGSAERFLHGGYVEWDEVYSRIRRLQENQK